MLGLASCGEDNPFSSFTKRKVEFIFCAPDFEYTDSTGYYKQPFGIVCNLKNLGDGETTTDWGINASFLGPYDNFFHDTLVKKVKGIDKDGNPIIEKHYKNFRYSADLDIKKGDKITISGFAPGDQKNCKNCDPSLITVVAVVDGVSHTIFKGGEWNGTGVWVVP